MLVTGDQLKRVREKIRRDGCRGFRDLKFPERFEDRGEQVLKKNKEFLRRLGRD